MTPYASEYPRRVAMISLHTSPLETPGVGDAGGLNVYVAELARRLGSRGVAVDIFTRRSDTATPDCIELPSQVRVLQVSAGPAAPVAKEQLPALIPDFAAAIADSAASYDVLHSHYWLSGMAALALSDRADVPVVHTMHTMARVKNAARGDDHLIEPDDRERGESQIVHRAKVLTANTLDEATELRDHYGARPEQIVIVPPGVDLSVFHPCEQPASRQRLGVGPDVQMILFVGRIQPLKAPDVLIRAVGEMIRRDPTRRERLRLVIVGGPSGPESHWAKSLPELARDEGLLEGPPDSAGKSVVHFRPHSARDELFRWYCASDLVAVPSYAESFGLVALEAQACGRAVVATDVGGLKHAVIADQTGILVHGHEPGRWADALEKVLDDDAARSEMQHAAALHAAEFSWDSTAAATLAAYRLARH